MRRLCHIPAFLALPVVLAGCGGATTVTDVSGPTGSGDPRCQPSLANLPATVSAAGGTVTGTLATTRDCAWTVTANVQWIALEPTSGQGEMTISVAVAENGVGLPRTGTLTVNSSGAATLSQEAAPCRFRLEQSTVTVPAAGGRVVVAVTATEECAWSVANSAPWIAVAQSGEKGSGTAELIAAANRGPVRTATLMIAGESVRVEQAASIVPPEATPPAPEPSPEPPPEQVTLEGIVSAVTGACPDLAFAVDGQIVHTTTATRFSGGNCTHVKDGVEVEVEGDRLGALTMATRVEIRRK